MQVLRALAFMHDLGLIHCDLKPENVMISDFSQPRVKIIDLGSSCFREDDLPSYVQSRAYRAPEVVIKAKYDGKIDVWSLGCILAELLSGSVLFQVRTASLCAPEVVIRAKYGGKNQLLVCARARVLLSSSESVRVCVAFQFRASVVALRELTELAKMPCRCCNTHTSAAHAPKTNRA